MILNDSVYERACEARPIWLGGTVLHESIMPLYWRAEAHGDVKIPLLYHADKLLSVRSATLEKLYTEGADYLLSDGCIVIPRGSAIPVMAWEEYNPAAAPDENAFLCSYGGYLAFAEGGEFHKRQCVVTYEHSDAWVGAVPRVTDALPATKKLFSAKAPITLGILGDSIAFGCNSSGLHAVPPYAPIWPELLADLISDQTGCAVKYVNKSVGGTASQWGRENTADFFKDTPPDLMVVAFGMNDASGDVDKRAYQDNIRAILRETLTLNPACEFLLVSTTIPNPLATQFYKEHRSFQPMLAELCREFGSRAALVPMTDMHDSLLAKKQYYHMTGNNINHPNDFLSRVYAQTALAVLGLGESL